MMVSPGTVRSILLTGLLSLPMAATVAIASTEAAQAQSLSLAQNTAPSPNSMPDANEDLRPLSQGSAVLSISGGQRLMSEASNAIASQNYDLAVQKLQQARQVFNQLSNFYQELGSSFSGIDNRIADAQRQQALQTAQMRDQATYQLALVHRAQNRPELAVPLLIQIIRSQEPTRELGQQAYRQLFELGFVNAPFPRGQEDSTSSAPRQ